MFLITFSLYYLPAMLRKALEGETLQPDYSITLLPFSTFLLPTFRFLPYT